MWKQMEQTFHSEILGVPREVNLKFRNIGIIGNSVPLDHDCSGLVFPSLGIESNIANPQASRYNIMYLTNV